MEGCREWEKKVLPARVHPGEKKIGMKWNENQ
jgi:hypothetical protein